MMALQSYLQPAVKPQPPSIDWQTLAAGRVLAPPIKPPEAIDWETVLAARLLSRPSGNTTINISGSGSGSSNITPDTHPANPTAWDDEFEYGTSLDTTGARFSGANPWSWQYPVGSFTSNVDRGYISLHAPSVGGSINLNMAVQPLSTTPFKIRTKQFDNWGDTIYGGGICVIGTSGRWYTFGKIFNAAVRLRVEHGNSATVVSGVDYTADIFSASNNARSWVHGIVLEIEYDGTLIYFRHSDTGKDGTFKTVFSTLLSTWLIDVASIGIFYKNNGTGTGPAGWTTLDWFRRIS